MKIKQYPEEYLFKTLKSLQKKQYHSIFKDVMATVVFCDEDCDRVLDLKKRKYR